MKKIDRSSKVRTGFHQAKWDEPVIFELSRPGERGILVNKADAQVASSVEGVNALPEFLKRKEAPALPEISSRACCATMRVSRRRRSAPT